MNDYKKESERFSSLDNAALSQAFLHMKICPVHRDDLLPVAFCKDTYGCPKCKETWHIPPGAGCIR